MRFWHRCTHANTRLKVTAVSRALSIYSTVVCICRLDQSFLWVSQCFFKKHPNVKLHPCKHTVAYCMRYIEEQTVTFKNDTDSVSDGEDGFLILPLLLSRLLFFFCKSLHGRVTRELGCFSAICSDLICLSAVHHQLTVVQLKDSSRKNMCCWNVFVCSEKCILTRFLQLLYIYTLQLVKTGSRCCKVGTKWFMSLLCSSLKYCMCFSVTLIWIPHTTVSHIHPSNHDVIHNASSDL